jgi:hypothetical protein
VSVFLVPRMGVYVFSCLHGPYVKVGHHMVTRGRPNAYYRIAGRGFASCVHPPELEGFLYVQHLHLLAWYPSLTRDDESAVHRKFASGKVGEFHSKEDAEEILCYLDSLGERKQITDAQKAKAVRWGYRKVRQAARRKARLAVKK